MGEMTGPDAEFNEDPAHWLKGDPNRNCTAHDWITRRRMLGKDYKICANCGQRLGWTERDENRLQSGIHPDRH